MQNQISPCQLVCMHNESTNNRLLRVCAAAVQSNILSPPNSFVAKGKQKQNQGHLSPLYLLQRSPLKLKHAPSLSSYPFLSLSLSKNTHTQALPLLNLSLLSLMAQLDQNLCSRSSSLRKTKLNFKTRKYGKIIEREREKRRQQKMSLRISSKPHTYHKYPSPSLSGFPVLLPLF